MAVVRPVFVWGQPGIGKSSLVREFATSLGLECVTLVGTQLAPEDLIGVPELRDGRSRFAPPETIARDRPYCLFLDELNSASPEVQKAFCAYVKTVRHQYGLDAIVRGDASWPRAATDRDLLYFFAEAFRARLVKAVAGQPGARVAVGAPVRLLVELAEISLECAQLVIATDDDGMPVLPAWFLVEVSRDLPRRVAARA